jgi:hypothetical protein
MAAPAPRREDPADVIVLAQRRRSRRRERNGLRSELWLVALVAAAIVAILFALARPFEAHARPLDDAARSALLD